MAACAIHASQHATAAFGGSLQSLAQRLQTMVNENESLREAMAKAASTLSSSQSPSEAIRIGNLSSLPADYTHVVVCSEYVSDPKDDALYPSLILEFKLPGDISAPASPSKIASSASKALSPALTTLLPRELDSMRAAEFVLSSLSCIATLIDVSTSYDSRDEGLVLKGSILFQNDLSGMRRNSRPIRAIHLSLFLTPLPSN